MNKVIIGLCLLVIGVPAWGQCASGASGVAPSATITFTPPLKNTDGTAISGAVSYNVYQGTSPGGEVKVSSGAVGSPISLTTGLSSGATYYWYITAVVGGVEGAASNEACKSFPKSAPAAVVITIT